MVANSRVGPARVSVVVPTHNSARTIRGTLESVLRQTAAPDQILVLDDGSTDATVSILRSYGDRIEILQQENTGVAAARNTLCARASGDLIAFLDHDDLWHPAYLEVQQRNHAAHPEAVALFTGHVDFHGYRDYEWLSSPPADGPLELIGPASFLSRYSVTAAPFGSASFLCVPRAVLARIGPEPFKVTAADDAYFCTWLPLLGPVAYTDVPLVAYRIHRAAQSTQKLKASELRIDVLELMEPHYEDRATAEIQTIFRSAFASKRRHYAKLLMGEGRHLEARKQLQLSIAHTGQPGSITKSLGLLAASYLPAGLQPAWPASQREWRDH
jgi:glycosyltransferase involved in cell wall biosynthesis